VEAHIYLFSFLSPPESVLVFWGISPANSVEKSKQVFPIFGIYLPGITIHISIIHDSRTGDKTYWNNLPGRRNTIAIFVLATLFRHSYDSHGLSLFVCWQHVEVPD
jgi:hypothetical protein